jgi:hypothetical protein
MAAIAQWQSQSTLSLYHANESLITRAVLRVTTLYRENRGHQLPVSFTITAAIPMTPAHDSNHFQDVAACEDITGQWSSPEQAIMAVYNDSQILYRVNSESEYAPINGAATRKDWLSDSRDDSYHDVDSNGYAQRVTRKRYATQ